jgi:hypothetical protein
MICLLEDDPMEYPRLSRRQLLRGTLAALFGWACAPRLALARPQAPAAPRTVAASGRVATWAQYFYDAEGRLVAMREGPSSKWRRV